MRRFLPVLPLVSLFAAACEPTEEPVDIDVEDFDEYGLMVAAPQVQMVQTGSGGRENCTNGVDDDADGRVDARDSDCAGRGFAGTLMEGSNIWPSQYRNGAGFLGLGYSTTMATRTTGARVRLSGNGLTMDIVTAANVNVTVITPATVNGADTMFVGTSDGAMYQILPPYGTATYTTY